MLTPYVANQLSGWNRGMGNIGMALYNAPRFRAMMAANLARAQEEQELGQLAKARTDLVNSQVAAAAADQTDDQNLSAALKKYAANPNDTDAQGDVIAGFGHAYKKNPESTAKALGDLFAQFQARGGSTNYNQMGALQGDAGKIATDAADNAEKAARPVIIPSGGTEATPQGAILATGGVTLPQGDERLSAADVDSEPDVIAVNPKPAKATGLPPSVLAPAFKQFLNNSQGGTNVVEALNDLNQYTGAPAGAGATSGHVVRVQRPDGQTGTIPAENLAKALQQGWKQLQ